MNQSQSPIRDPLIDEVRETRARLVREHGGLRGWVAYLQEQQRQHLKKLQPRRTKGDKSNYLRVNLSSILSIIGLIPFFSGF